MFHIFPWEIILTRAEENYLLKVTYDSQRTPGRVRSGRAQVTAEHKSGFLVTLSPAAPVLPCPFTTLQWLTAGASLHSSGACCSFLMKANVVNVGEQFNRLLVLVNLYF